MLRAFFATRAAASKRLLTPALTIRAAAVDRCRPCSSMTIAAAASLSRTCSATAALSLERSFSSFTPQSFGERPFRILGVQQIAIGCAERDPLRHLWNNILGLSAAETDIRIERENVVEDILSIGLDDTSAVEIDLMTPIDAEKSPKVHQPPLNHVGLWVNDLAAAVLWMTARGVRFTPGGIRQGAAGHDVAFIHPKGNDAHPVGGNGVLIELVQAPQDVIAAAAEAKQQG